MHKNEKIQNIFWEKSVTNLTNITSARLLRSTSTGISHVIACIFVAAAAAAAKSLQSCPTLCDPIDGSPPGSAVPGILQARTLEWVAISFSNAWKEKWKWSRSVMSNSSRPHGLQPTRLLHPWDLPGKSTGVGCHCLLHVSLLWCDKNGTLTLQFPPPNHNTSIIKNNVPNGGTFHILKILNEYSSKLLRSSKTKKVWETVIA